MLPSVPGQIVFQLQGQAGVPYVIQSSTNLTDWIHESTNTPVGGLLNITNPVATAPSARFWRALWQP